MIKRPIPILEKHLKNFEMEKTSLDTEEHGNLYDLL